MMLSVQRTIAMAIGASLLLVACSGRPSKSLDVQCAEGLKSASTELENAKIAGFGGTLHWSKAAALLTAAKVQQQFEKYPNCVDKVKRARYYIKKSEQ